MGRPASGTKEMLIQKGEHNLKVLLAKLNVKSPISDRVGTKQSPIDGNTTIYSDGRKPPYPHTLTDRQTTNANIKVRVKETPILPRKVGRKVVDVVETQDLDPELDY